MEDVWRDGDGIQRGPHCRCSSRRWSRIVTTKADPKLFSNGSIIEFSSSYLKYFVEFYNHIEDDCICLVSSPGISKVEHLRLISLNNYCAPRAKISIDDTVTGRTSNLLEIA